MQKCCYIYKKKSSNAHQTLKDFQEYWDMPKLAVIQEVSTRWSSCLHMIERLLKIKKPVVGALEQCDKEELILCPQDWELLGALADFLKFFDRSTRLVSGETYSTLPIMRPILDKMRLHLEVTPRDHETIIEMKREMSENLSGRYQSYRVKEIIDIATVFDPRNRYNNNYFSPEIKDLVIAKTIDIHESSVVHSHSQAQNTQVIPATQGQELSNLSIFNAPSCSSVTATTTSQQVTQSSDDPIILDDREAQINFACSIFSAPADAVVISDERTLVEQVTSELEMYIKYPAAPANDPKFDAIKWWKEKQCVFPLLFKTFKQYSCVPATSVPSERAFSAANNVVTKLRNRLRPENVYLLTFLNANKAYISKGMLKF